MTGITAVEKQFGWDILQDLIHVPSRNHRRGSSKVCPQLVQDQDSDIFAVCGKFGDLKHSLTECLASRDKFSFLREILETFLDRKISTEEVIFLSFRHYDEKKIKMGTWFVVKSLGYIFRNIKSECEEMVLVLKQELYYHQLLERGFVPKKYLLEMLEIVENWD